jgi:hypothetical protein
MKAINTRKLISLSVLTACLMTLSVGEATAQSPRSEVVKAQHAGPTPKMGQPKMGQPKVVSQTHQPKGTPHKASSFAPHPTNRRVFGDPIQPPIFHSAPKKPNPK